MALAGLHFGVPKYLFRCVPLGAGRGVKLGVWEGWFLDCPAPHVRSHRGGARLEARLIDKDVGEMCKLEVCKGLEVCVVSLQEYENAFPT